MDAFCRSLAPGVLFLSLVFVSASKAPAQRMSVNDLRTYTEWAARTNQIVLPVPKFDWSGDFMQYRLYAVNDSYGLDENDPMSIPIREQFTVVAIRKYRNQARQRQFWRPVLQRVEQEIAGMVLLIQSSTLGNDKLFDSLREKSRKIKEIYATSLTDLARREGKRGAQSEDELCYACFTVKLQTDPVNGKIYYISGGRWSLYVYWTQERGVSNYPQPEWEPAEQPDHVTLTGKNWFNVQWPDGRRYFHLVNIQNGDAITFRPD